MSNTQKIDEDAKRQTLEKINLLNEKTGLTIDNIVKIVQDCWKDVFTISDKAGNFIIGKTVFPKPQIMGFILEALIAKKFEAMNPNQWIFDPTGYSKDITNKIDDSLSVEIKTSSSKGHIYGNRSYANAGSTSKKSKNSFYLAINFSKFNESELGKKPSLTKIRLGYLVHSDWQGQSSQTGQNARLSAITERSKLLELWPFKDESLEVK